LCPELCPSASKVARRSLQRRVHFVRSWSDAFPHSAYNREELARKPCRIASVFPNVVRAFSRAARAESPTGKAPQSQGDADGEARALIRRPIVGSDPQVLHGPSLSAVRSVPKPG